ncbi:MAG: DUF2344 domain-containing protein [Clostridia bacterium]|nr:DUF2344 domain-containing protein [Clostridia bacterium]
METLRILYTKDSYMRFLGHLELMKLFERVFRFNKLPLKFSEGFNPIPRLTFASPLSVGYSSKAEVMEVILNSEISIQQVKDIKFPNGIKVLDAQFINCKHSLMSKLEFAEYILKVEYDSKVEQLPFEEWVESFLNEKEIFYEKKTKRGTVKAVNALGQIHDMKLLYNADNEVVFRVMLQTGSNGSLNPEKLVDIFGSHYKLNQKAVNIDVERLGLYFTKNGTLTNLYELSEEE